MNGSKEGVSFHPIKLSPRGSLEPLRMSERLGYGLRVAGAVGGVALAMAGIAGVAGLMLWGISEKDQSASDQSVAAWIDIMGNRLEEPDHNLLPGEKFHPRMMVVAAGETMEELNKMQQKGFPVNVRNFPATHDPNGGQTKVIGQIYPGREVLNVILTAGRQPDSVLPGKWGAFDCSLDSPNAQVISWEAGMKPTPEEKRICAIYGIYLAPSSVDE